MDTVEPGFPLEELRLLIANHRERYPCFTAAQCKELDLDIDQELYNATDARAEKAVAHYLGLGANPLTLMPDGDCAARLGCGKMMEAYMVPEWVNATHQGTGETGLHTCAHITQHVLYQMDFGADPLIACHQGIRPIDLAPEEEQEAIWFEVARRDKRLIASTLGFQDDIPVKRRRM